MLLQAGQIILCIISQCLYICGAGMEDAEWWAQQGSLEGCKWEEQEAKKAVDRASKFMKDEKYQRAISLLEKAERLSPGFKGLSELLAVAEVCLAAIWEQCTCQARPQHRTPDWYRILKVLHMAKSAGPQYSVFFCTAIKCQRQVN